MSLDETYEEFYKEIIEYFSNIGDDRQARQHEEIYQKLKSEKDELEQKNSAEMNLNA